MRNKKMRFRPFGRIVVVTIQLLSAINGNFDNCRCTRARFEARVYGFSSVIIPLQFKITEKKERNSETVKAN